MERGTLGRWLTYIFLPRAQRGFNHWQSISFVIFRSTHIWTAMDVPCLPHIWTAMDVPCLSHIWTAMDVPCLSRLGTLPTFLNPWAAVKSFSKATVQTFRLEGDQKLFITRGRKVSTFWKNPLQQDWAICHHFICESPTAEKRQKGNDFIQRDTNKKLETVTGL